MKLIAKKIFYLSFGNGTAVLANTLSLAVASRYLSHSHYATYRQTFLPYEALVPFLCLGLPSAVYYLLPRRNDKLNLFFECTSLLILISSVFSLFIALGGAEILAEKFNNPYLSTSLKYLIFYPFFQLPISLFISVLIYEGKTRIVGIYSSISSLVLSVSVVLSAIKFQDYNYLVFFKAILPVFGFFLLFVIIFKLFYGLNKPTGGFFSNSKTILSISLPLGIASMVGAVSQQMDKILVSYFSNPTDFAIYVNGAVEIPLIGVITGSISSVLLGEMSESIKKEDFKKAHFLFKATANKSALFLFPAMIYLLFSSKEFIIALFSDKYIQSSLTFKIYLLLIPIRIVVFGSALIALGKGAAILRRSAFELIFNIILSVLFYKYFGFNGVAIATILVIYLWSVPYNLFEISRGFKVEKWKLFDYIFLCKVAALSLLFCPIIIFLNYFNMNVYLFLVISMSAYFLSVGITFLKLNMHHC